MHYRWPECFLPVGSNREDIEGAKSVGETVKDARVYNRHMHDVVVYSRKGCHLCDVVKEILTQVQGEADFRWREVDIDADSQFRQEYNDQVPVVLIDGRKAFKYRMDRHQFLRVLAGQRDPSL